MNCCCPAGFTFVFFGARPAVIMVIVVNVCIINNGCFVVDSWAIPVVVPVHTALVHVSGGEESPVCGRNIHIDIDINTRPHWRPSVIAAAASPRHPGRRPFITGNPCPAVVVVVNPPSVMERRPTPGVVRHPSVSVIGHYPVSVGGIRMKIPSHIGYPDASVATVANPSPVRPQFVIEHIERNTATPVSIVIVFVFVITVVVVSL